MNLSEPLGEIFHQALALEGEAREAFLSNACGDDHGLRRDVDNLLRAVDAGNTWFDALPERLMSIEFSSLLESPSRTDSEKARVGPWQLRGLLGRGGMGSVYLAERADFQYARQVAIKILPAGADDPVARYRFKSEQHILAQLNHENIARFIDGGMTEDGVRYFAMDYIKGVPIDEFCKNHRAGLRGTLELFIQICRAVHYAHQHKVVHRDLKPPNILVTEQNEVKLLDFGIAKVLENESAGSDLTRMMLRPLTMAYASPEMLNGETIDAKTDIYSLGVILFELLVGEKPYKPGHGLSGYYQQVCAGLRKNPSQLAADKFLAKQLRGDLDTIIRKALHASKAARYTTVRELQEDVERFLAGHPIKARPYSPLYYLGRFIQRNQRASFIALTIFVVLSSSTVFSFLQMREAQAQRDLANQQQRHVQATNDFLNLLLEEVGPGGEPMTLEQLLQKGIAMLEQQSATQTTRDHMGKVMLELAQAFGSIGKTEETLSLLRRAERYAREQQDNDLLSEVLCTSTEYNIHLDFDLARDHYNQARRIQAKLPETSLNSSIVCNKAWAMILEKTGQSRKALEVTNESIARLQSVNPGAGNLLFSLLSLKTHSLYTLGKQQELLDTNETLLELYRKSGRASTTSYLITLQNRAILLDVMGEIIAAAELRKSIVDKFNGESGQQVPHRFLAHHADSLMRLGRYAEALEVYRESLHQAESSGDSLRAAHNRMDIGAALIELGEYGEAEKYLQLAESQYRQSPLANKRRLDRLNLARASSLRKREHLSEARDIVETLLASMDYPNVRHGFPLGRLLREAALICLDQTDYESAEKYIQDYLHLSGSLARENARSADVGFGLGLRAEYDLAQARLDDAKRYFLKASETLAAGAGVTHPDAISARQRYLELHNMQSARLSSAAQNISE